MAFDTHTSRSGRVKQVSAAFANEERVQQAGGVDGSNAEDSWPLEVFWPREYHGSDVREHLEQVLEGGLNRGERAPVISLDFILDNVLSAEVKAPETNPAQRNAHHQTRSRDRVVRSQRIDVREKPTESRRKPYHLPRQAPYA